jgi:hypothetical protein
MQRMLNLNPPIGGVIQMWPKGHPSQGYHYYLMTDSSMDEFNVKWLEGLVADYKAQMQVAAAVAAPVEVITKEGLTILPQSVTLVDGKKPRISTAVHPLLVTEQDRYLCSCKHTSRVHLRHNEECQEIGCECQKFEMTFESEV